MNRTEFEQAVARSDGVSKVSAKRAVAAVLRTLTHALRKGEEVQFKGFGTFKIAKRNARTGRNPRTGAAVKIKASKAVRFTAGSGLKRKVNGDI